MNAEQQFEKELEIFRKECEGAAQFFYAYLGMHEVAKHDEAVLRLLNENSLFWNTVAGALQTSALIALHRILNSRSRHNVDSLLSIAEENLDVFSKQALGRRKQGNAQSQPSWLKEFLTAAYAPSKNDFKRFRDYVAKYKNIYETKYAGLRNKVFAHKVASDPSEVQKLVAPTNIREMERLFVFLLKLHEALSQLFESGRKPALRPLRYSARKLRSSAGISGYSRGVHEHITKETVAVLQACAAKIGV